MRIQPITALNFRGKKSNFGKPPNKISNPPKKTSKKDIFLLFFGLFALAVGTLKKPRLI